MRRILLTLAVLAILAAAAFLASRSRPDSIQLEDENRATVNMGHLVMRSDPDVSLGYFGDGHDRALSWLHRHDFHPVDSTWTDPSEFSGDSLLRFKRLTFVRPE